MSSNEQIQLENIDNYKKSLFNFIICTIIGILIFFVPVSIGGAQSNIIFGILVDFMVNTLGIIWTIIITIMVTVNFIAYLIGKKADKNSKLYEYYKSDSLFQGIFYFLAAIYAPMYLFKIGPDFIIGGATSGLVQGSIVPAVGWIIPLGGLFIPLFLAFGGLEFIGTLLEPLMRPAFKVPGKCALDTVASFVGASSIGAYLTSRIYKDNGYTKREAASIACNFSVVSVGFAAFCADTVGLLPIFPKVFITAFIITYIVALIMVRIPPLTTKPDVYYNGKVQTERDRNENADRSMPILKLGYLRAIKKSSDSDGIIKEVSKGFIDSWALLPKVLSLVTAVGVTALIFAEFTPVFTWIGKPMIPILQLFRVPDAVAIAPSTLIGITEMYLPVLLIADLGLSIGARFFVTVLTLVQIIFFAETAVVILVTGVPVTAKELVIVFFERTFIAIPLISLAVHLLF